MVKREASLYDQMFMISNKIQNNNLFMRKIVVLQIVAFYLFSCHKDIRDIRKKIRISFLNSPTLRRDMETFLFIGGMVIV